MKTYLNSIDWIALILTIIGGVNWGLVGLANYNLVEALFGTGSALSTIVYALVGLSAIYLLLSLLSKTSETEIRRAV